MDLRRVSSLPWKFILPAVMVLINVAFLAPLIWGSGSLYTWHSLKERRSELSQEVDDLNRKRSALSREIRLLKADPAYVEKIIRNRLNYVKKNEILYIFDKGAQHSAWEENDSNVRAE
ncbi:MAG: septum formation initiator family protein [Mailhella sp.]|nr:septum formation initiator family protein [Mailhella sp.]